MRETKVIRMSFNDAEAKGVLELKRCGYGAELWVDGVCVAFIDLYYRTPVDDDGDPHSPDDAGKIHIQIEDPDYPGGDPLGHVYLHPRYTDFMVEKWTGVQYLEDAGRWPTLRYMRAQQGAE